MSVERASAISASGSETDHALAHEIDDRHRIGVGAAEIEAKQAAGPVQIANGERRVEAHLVAQHLDLIGAGVQAQHKPRRIAGEDLQHGEHHHGGQDQRGESDDEAFEEVGGHGTRASVVSSSWGGAGAKRRREDPRIHAVTAAEERDCPELALPVPISTPKSPRFGIAATLSGHRMDPRVYAVRFARCFAPG